MDRYEALYQFWSSFGIPAYRENRVPDVDEISYPYLTYEARTGVFDADVVANTSIWTRGTLEEADALADAVEGRLKNGGEIVHFDNGSFWITIEPNSTQDMDDPNDDAVIRKLITVVYHF